MSGCLSGDSYDINRFDSYTPHMKHKSFKLIIFSLPLFFIGNLTYAITTSTIIAAETSGGQTGYNHIPKSVGGVSSYDTIAFPFTSTSSVGLSSMALEINQGNGPGQTGILKVCLSPDNSGSPLYTSSTAPATNCRSFDAILLTDGGQAGAAFTFDDFESSSSLQSSQGSFGTIPVLTPLSASTTFNINASTTYWILLSQTTFSGGADNRLLNYASGGVLEKGMSTTSTWQDTFYQSAPLFVRGNNTYSGPPISSQNTIALDFASSTRSSSSSLDFISNFWAGTATRSSSTPSGITSYVTINYYPTGTINFSYLDTGYIYFGQNASNTTTWRMDKQTSLSQGTYLAQAKLYDVTGDILLATSSLTTFHITNTYNPLEIPSSTLSCGFTQLDNCLINAGKALFTWLLVPGQNSVIHLTQAITKFENTFPFSIGFQFASTTRSYLENTSTTTDLILDLNTNDFNFHLPLLTSTTLETAVGSSTKTFIFNMISDVLWIGGIITTLFLVL